MNHNYGSFWDGIITENSVANVPVSEIGGCESPEAWLFTAVNFVHCQIKPCEQMTCILILQHPNSFPITNCRRGQVEISLPSPSSPHLAFSQILLFSRVWIKETISLANIGSYRRECGINKVINCRLSAVVLQELYWNFIFHTKVVSSFWDAV